MKQHNKLVSSLLLSFCFVALFSSCYKKFDADSYKPPFTINGYSSVKDIASSSLVGYWSFDGSLTDSVSGNAGTNTGTSFTPGFKGQAMQGALNSYVLAAPSSQITGLQSFTISEWLNTPPPSTGIIGVFSLAKTDGFWGNIEIFFENGSDNTNGKVRVHVFNGTDDKTFSVDNVSSLFNSWVNLTVSYSASDSTFALYKNGAAVSSGHVAGVSGPIKITNPGNLVFGCVQFQTDPSQTSATGSQDWASYLTGQLDEVRIYNSALSAKDINAMIVLQGKGK